MIKWNTFQKQWIDFCNTLPKLNMETGPWIAGGSVRKLFLNQDPFLESDIDVFFHDHDQYVKWKAEYEAKFVMPHQQNQIDLDDLDAWIAKPKIWTIKPTTWSSSQCETDNAITYEYVNDELNIYTKVQLIHKQYYPNLEAAWANFDIDVCRFGSVGAVSCMCETIMDAINTDTAHLTKGKSKDAAARVIKYLMYGYEFDLETLEWCSKELALGHIPAWDEY